jgi:predicted phage tail protein
MMDTEVIGKKGGKGGDGGAARTPIEEDNTLKANTKAIIDYVIGEGVIGGLVNGGQSIFIDGTPVLDSSGRANFKGVSWNERLGYPGQDPIPGINALAREEGVGAELLYNVPLVRTITDTDLDALETKIRLSSLYEIIESGDNAGDRVKSNVQHRIEVNPNGGGYVTHAEPVIRGKTTSVYEKSYHVTLPGDGPWDVRVTRLTPDSESQALQNESFWWGYTELIQARFSYPGIAHTGVIIDAEQFGGQIKKTEFYVYGRVLSVPSNYDPETRVYTGIWDGTFTPAWSDNPAWVIYDILTNNVYGLGQYIDAALTDKWLLYEIAKYCDGLVPDGLGGEEPRFTFNGEFRERQDAYQVITELLASIRAINYWAGGTVRFSQDAPGDSEMIISQADVIDGMFDYSNTGLKSRHSVVYVGWKDPLTNENDIELVDDVELIQQYGIRPLQVKYKGCTSRGQAYRYGRWILESEKIENSIVNFAGGFKFAGLMPGALVDIADDVIAGVRFGGRVKSISSYDVTLDGSVTLDPAETYTLTVTNADLTLSEANITSTGASDVVTVDALLSPKIGGSALVTGTDVAPRQFRVLLNSQTEKNIFSITALLHDPTKFDRIEQDIDLAPASYTSYRTGDVLPPLNLSKEEYLYKEGLAVHSAAVISWTPPNDERVSRFNLEVKRPGEDDWSQLHSGFEPSYTLIDTIDGTYTFRVQAVTLTNRSEFIESSFNILSLSAPPADVTNFRSQIIDKMIVLSWDAIADLDLSHYQVRHTKSLTPAWDAAVIVENEIKTTSLVIPVLGGTYLIKAVDTSGIQSPNAVGVTNGITKDLLALNVVELVENEVGFTGVKTSTVFDAGLNALRLDTADDIYDWADIYDIDDVYYGDTGLASVGYYEFGEVVDLTDKFTSRISTSITLSGADIFSDIYVIDDIYAVQNIYGADPAEYGFELQISTSDDMIAWSAWTPLIIGDTIARGLKFRAKLSTTLPNISPLLESASIDIDMPDRVYAQEDVTCPVNGMTHTYAPAFKAKPALGITAQDMQTGDYFTLTNQGAVGFDIEFFDSTDTSISRTYDILTKGYGHVSS